MKCTVYKIAALFAFLLTGVSAIACTTFCLQKNGKKVFGKNYDWVTGTGAVHINLSGIEKTALTIEAGTPLTWTSKYGSISFNQFGKEFPNGGMNEKGLVVELMWLSESSYPQKDQRPSLSVLQWIQYQLDNARTVAEVIASDKTVRIFNTGTPQHYLVADMQGSVATIEFLNGKMVFHSGNTLPHRVLANSPYAASLAAFKKNNSQQNNSLERFASACEMVKNFEEQHTDVAPVDYAFDILKNVAQGSFTKWSIVYDIDNRLIYFQTGNGKRRSIAFNQFSFSCNGTAKSYNIENNQQGEVSRYFSNYSPGENKQLIKKAFQESKSQFTVATALQDQMGKLADSYMCAD